MQISADKKCEIRSRKTSPNEFHTKIDLCCFFFDVICNVTNCDQTVNIFVVDFNAEFFIATESKLCEFEGVDTEPIMIFDDSLSAVDTQTDAKIRQAIAKKFGKASVILISHRITTLSAADKIIVLDRGRIVEEGTHEELKQGGGIYQKIYEAQSGSKEVAV